MTVSPGTQAKRRFDAKLRAIRFHANALLVKKIRGICKRDKLLYNSLFTYPVIILFSKKFEIKPKQIINILLRDLYINFNSDDAKVWNIYTSKVGFYIMNTRLKRLGYINKEGRGAYYLTLKGKALVKEFNQFYDEQVKSILKKTGNGDKETIRKVLRAKPTRQRKFADPAPGKKP